MIWLAPFVQHTNKSGKGGPSQTTYSYTQSIAIGLCEAVIDGGQAIAGLSRVWENGTIVYDIRPQQQANTVTGQRAETDDQYADRLTASAIYAATFTLYLGDETQTADPTIEAVQGFGNVPAFRALAYIVYPNRNLQTTQGWRHPNFTFEIFQSGAGQCIDSSEYSNEVLYPWESPGSLDPRNPLNLHDYQFSGIEGGGRGPIRDTLSAALADGPLADKLYGWDPSGGGSGQYSPWLQPAHFSSAPPFGFLGTEQQICLYYNKLTASTYTYGIVRQADLAAWWAANPNGYWIGDKGPDGYTTHGIGATNFDDGVLVNRHPSAPADPCYGLPVSPFPGYCIRGDGKLIKAGPWTLDNTRTFKVLAGYYVIAPRGGIVLQLPLNPCLPPGSPEDNSTFWTAAYDAAVAAGTMPSGYTYGTQYPQSQGFGYTIDMQVCTGAGSGVSIAEIITALCSRAGISAIDVADLTSITISGYSISSISDATNAIQPLRSVGFFDAVESNATLFFRARGKPIVATLTADQIGAYDGGSSGATVPPSVTVARVDETTLPRSIRLHYKSVARDYQDAQQSSPFRLTTRAINDQDVSLPFCMGDTQALQAAEILWNDAWAGKNTYTIAIDQSLSEIEVGDALGIPIDNVLQRARIISEQNASGVLRKLSLVSDNDGAYISFAIAEVSQVQPQVLTLLAGTQIELLDLPALQDADNDPGFYIAAERTGPGNAWRGCVIYKSIDGGATWVTQFSMVVEATVGALHADPPVSEYFTWDDTSTITIDLNDASYSLESRSDDAVLAGANAAAIGADGRWEVIQFANATQLSATQWRISRLLRGRRGTEHNVGASFAGDAFVILSTGDLSRMVLSSTEIGALRSYDAPSIGASFSSGTVYPFAGHAQALKPFSPVDVHAILESDGDILIRWTRRDRLGGTLMSGVDMPLSEATLAFQIDIIEPNSPHAVLRTLTTSTTSVIYTHAQQIADFGSSSITSLSCAVYQMSAIVGRGIAAIQTISVGNSP